MADLLPERITRRLEPDGECIIWTGALQRNGYGYTRWKVAGRWKNVRVHRLMWETFVGPIPVDREIDHVCRVRRCVRPSHLRVVSHAENQRRMRNCQSAKTACPRGHLYDTFTARGRSCSICTRAALRRHRQRKVASDY